MRKNLWSKKPSFELRPMCAAVLLAFSVNASANPNGGTVVNGSASFNTNGNTLTVTNTPGTIINWQGFSINSNEITHFAQQSASSAVLNRVITSNPSVILGTLSSNGRVFLVNPGGIVFGAGSTVNVAGMVATSLNLSDADFLAGRGNFTLTPGAQAVSNAGNITAQSGGEIYLIAPNVENSGVITAPNGEILLAAGHEVQLVNTLDPNLRVNITAPAGDATNIGQLVASAGRLGLFGTVVKNTGTVSAGSATLQGGKIVFRSSQRTEVSGTVTATGDTGGSIHALSNNEVRIGAVARIDASGNNGGGTILIGGDAHGGNANVQNAQSTTVDASATIKANAIQNGDGGKVVVWANGATEFSGHISARGGAVGGDGGWVEVSGKQWLAYSGLVDTTAINGLTGDLLLDPASITISSLATSAGYTWDGVLNAYTNATGTPSNLNVGTLVVQLGLSNVTVDTTAALAGVGDITVLDSIIWNSANSLTLNAVGTGSITVNALDSLASPLQIANGGAGGISLISAQNIVVNGDLSTVGGNVLLNANTAGLGGAIVMGTGSSILSNGGNITLGGGVAGNGLGAAVGNATYASGIELLGATLNAGGGLIYLNGQGDMVGATNMGVHLSSSSVTTSGTGSIKINGVGGGGLVSGANRGVRIDADHLLTASLVSTASGGIDISAQGGNRGDGFHLLGGSDVVSTSGTINIVANSGTEDAASATLVYGAWISDAGTTISSTDGYISITAQSFGAVGNSNRGLVLEAGAQVVTTGTAMQSGTIYMKGIGGLDGDGILMNGIIQTAGGEIMLDGTSGDGTGNERGIMINSAGAHILSTTGKISLSGKSIATSNASNYGVYLSDTDNTGIQTGGDIWIYGDAQPGSTNYGVNLWDFVNAAGTANITSNGSILIQKALTPQGNMLVRADVLGTGSGTVVFSGAGSITSQTGKKVDLYYNPVSYTDAATQTSNASNPYSTKLLGTGANASWMLVNNLNQLQAMNTNLAGHYALGMNLDASATSTWNAGAGFAPIGNLATPFSGRFTGASTQSSGAYATISNLNILRPNDLYVGLFGVTNSTSIISNIELVGGHVASYGPSVGGLFNAYVGSLVGYNSGQINHAHSSASVMGANNGKVGGLVGFNATSGSIGNSSAQGAVVGYVNAVNAGGLVGSNAGAINTSYASGAVSANYSTVGGLVGWNENTGTVNNSYALGSVSGNNYESGGLLGRNNGNFTNNYATGAVSSVGGALAYRYVGGVVGWNNVANGTNNFWDTTTTGQATGSGAGYLLGVTGLGSTAAAMTQANYANAGWDFANTWWMSDTNTRPFLRSEWTTNITNAHQLQLVGMNLSAHYTVLNDIDLNEVVASASGMWDINRGFAPIGNAASAFTGWFDGASHNISHLTINRPLETEVGLFGRIGASGFVYNVTIAASSVTGGNTVGVLAGNNLGQIFNARNSSSNATGDSVVGGLVGRNQASISGSSVDGAGVGNTVNLTATAFNGFGGLVGVNSGTIGNSYAVANVSVYDAFGTTALSVSNIGGLVGSNSGGIYSSYADSVVYTFAGGLSSAVTSLTNVGGLAGSNIGSILNAYALGPVTSNYGGSGVGTTAGAVGGLVGSNSGFIGTTYASGSVLSALTDTINTTNLGVGGLVGAGNGTVGSSYWDTVTTGQATSAGGVGVAALATTAAAMTQANYVGWDFNNAWWMSEGNTRPFLRSEWTTNITNAHQLQLMEMNLSADYTLANNIDLAEVRALGSGMWDINKGFAPIGNINAAFTGTFDGRNFTISALSINRSAENNIGLFGYCISCTIQNANLVGGSVIGGWTTGALVGYAEGAAISFSSNQGVSVDGQFDVGGLIGNLAFSSTVASSVDASYSTGAVFSLLGDRVGGLIGQSNGTVSRSYSTGSVEGSGSVGGLVGEANGTISDSYAMGSVSGTWDVGGLIGFNGADVNNAYSSGYVSPGGGGLIGWLETGVVSNSYWNVDTSGRTFSDGGVGLTAPQMKDSASFTGFDFANTWNIVTGTSTPYLRWRFATSAPQIVSGSYTDFAMNHIVQLAIDGVLLEDASLGANGEYLAMLDSGRIADGQMLMASVPWPFGDYGMATSVRRADGNDMLGLDMMLDTLTVSSNNAVAVSIADLDRANNFAVANSGYSSISGDGESVTLDAGVTFMTTAGTNFLLNGRISSTSDQIWNGAVTVGPNAALVTTTRFSVAGNIVFNDIVSGANRLEISTQGTVTQGVGASITVSELNMLGVGGSYTLNNSGNEIAAIGGNTGSVNLTNNAVNWSVGIVDSLSGLPIGLTTTGGVILSTDGIATQAPAGLGTSAISATSLNLLGAGGDYTFNDAGNAVGLFAGNTGRISFKQSGSLALGNINTTGNLLLSSNDHILLTANATLSSNGGNIELTSDADGTTGGAIYLDTGSTVDSADGNIRMGGMPSTGRSIGNGTVFNSITFNSGIYVLGDITAGAGNVTMLGEGTSNPYVLGDGIMFAGGTLSSNGMVTIDGLAHTWRADAGCSPNCNYVAGVHFANTGTRLSTVAGAVSITGVNTYTGAGVRAQGITIENATIETTGAGTLVLSGSFTGMGAPDTNYGIGLVGGTVQTTAVGGGIVVLDGTSSIDGGLVLSGGGKVLSNGGEIRMTGTGGASWDAIYIGDSGTLVGGNASGNILLQAINANRIAVANSASINAGANILTVLAAGGQVADLSSGLITAGALRLLGAGTYSFTNTSNNIGTLATNVTGAVTYNDANGFSIGSISSFDGVSVTATTGVTTNTNNFTASANSAGNITLDAGSFINTGTSNIVLSAASGHFINNSGSATPFTAMQTKLFTAGPAGNVRGGLMPSASFFNCADITCAPATIPTTGTNFLYVQATAPTLTITANAIGKLYGDVDPVLTYGTSGLVVGDALGDVLSGGLTRAIGENVGVYPISQTGLTVDTAFGYNVNYVGADLTISPFVVNLTGSRIYDATSLVDAAILVMNTLPNSETLTLGGAGVLANKNIGTNKTFGVGTLALSNGTGLATNYTLVGGTHLVTVAAATITTVDGITANNRSYDGTSVAGLTTSGAVFNGMFGGDALNVAGATGSFADKNVGTGKAVSITGITLGGADAGNYILQTNTASSAADISKATLTVTADSTNKVLGTTDPALTYMVAGLYDPQDSVVGGSLSRDLGENIGSYSINGEGLVLLSSNYSLNYVAGTFTILAPTVVQEITQIALQGSPEEEDKEEAGELLVEGEIVNDNNQSLVDPLPVCN